jgi:hypothetical protein
VTSRTFVLPLLLLLHGGAWADIELRSSKEEAEPRSTTITLGIKSANENVETEMTLRYPGSAKTTMQNGEEKLMLANKDSSIVAFNFRAGTQANDSVALALSSSGRLVYFFDLNHVIVELVAKWKKGLDEESFRVTDVTGDSIILDYYEHYQGQENPNFRVIAHVLSDGSLKVSQDDIKSLAR